MWKCLNAILPKKKKNVTCGEIIFESGATINEYEIGCNFNDFFVKSIMQINAEIPLEDQTIETIVPNHTFKFKNVNVDEICKITKQLTRKINKSQICNSMVWNDATEYAGYHLCEIINKSMNEGKFPDCWKMSTITPIPKIKNTNKYDEFRPINTMPNDEKVLECVVKEQLTDYLNEHNILYEKQSAYRPGHSCESAINLLITDWKESIENGEIVLAVFLDLKRAFETVSREIMTIKLANIGIIGNELDWFVSYMTNRQQRVKFNGSLSEANTVPIGKNLLIR